MEEKRPEEAPEPEADPRDLVRVVTTTYEIGRDQSRIGGGTRLRAGGGFGIRRGDLTDFLLPLALVLGALAWTNRERAWHPELLERYLPSAVRHFIGNSVPGPAPGASGGATSWSGSARPAAAAEQPATGASVDVVLEVEVESDGSTGAIHVVKSAGTVSDQLAIAKASLMRFEPARRGGVAVATRMKITVSVPRV